MIDDDETENVDTIDDQQKALEQENDKLLDTHVAGEEEIETPKDDTTEASESEDTKDKGEVDEEEGVGESHAYANLGNQGKSLNNPKGKRPKGSISSGATPPERKAGKGGGGRGDDFMNAVWNELIIPFYTGCIDKAVDWTLDFTDWVLYMPFSGSATVDNPDVKQKKTVFNIADDLVEQHIKRTDEKLKIFKEAHEELKSNIEKYKRGESVEWSVWEQEPEFFKELVKISVAAENPNSPEAETWKHFNKAPELVEAQLNKEKVVRKMAIYLGALDLAFKKADSDKFVEKLDEKAEEYYNTITENIGKIHEQNKGDPKKERETVHDYLMGLKISIEDGVKATQEYLDQSGSERMKEYAKEVRRRFWPSSKEIEPEEEIIGENKENKKEAEKQEDTESTKTKAEKAIKSAIDTVNSFSVNYQTLGDISAPEKTHQDILGGSKKEEKDDDAKQQVLAAMRRIYRMDK